MAQHFNSTGHSISDVQVRGVALCSVTNVQRRQREMQLIFSNRHRSAERTEYQFQFHLNWDVVYILRARASIIFMMSMILRGTVQRFFLTLKKGHKPETFVFF